jgi:hypothetical protein
MRKTKLNLPCRTVLAAGQRNLEVIGPLIGGRGRRASTRLLVELIDSAMKIERPVDGEDMPRIAAYGRSIKFILNVRSVVCEDIAPPVATKPCARL